MIDFSVRQLSNNVIDFSVRQLSNKTNIPTYILTYRHHSDQISRSAWTARLKRKGVAMLRKSFFLRSRFNVSRSLSYMCFAKS